MYSAEKDDLESKIVLLGLAQSGKTSIRQITFENYAPKATKLNPATVRINRRLFNLAGSSLNIFDIGGQTEYLNEALSKFRERTFLKAKAIVYVIDVADSLNLMRSKYYFEQVYEAKNELSSDAKIFVFLHKMDKIPLSKREDIEASIKEIFQFSNYTNVDVLPTSIFEDSLIRAIQEVVNYAYPQDIEKKELIKDLFQDNELNLLAISTSLGLILYSHPPGFEGFNYSRLHTELINLFSFMGNLRNTYFDFEFSDVFIKEIDEDLVITSSFPKSLDYNKQHRFNKICEIVSDTFYQKEDLLSTAKSKLKESLKTFLLNNGIENKHISDYILQKKFKIYCDVCGRPISKSLLDIGVEAAGKFKKSFRIDHTANIPTIEALCFHECIDGLRAIPTIFDESLNYVRFTKSYLV